MMRTPTALLAALLGLVAAAPARAGDAPDFEAGRGVHSDFDLDIQLEAGLKNRLTVAVGRAEEYAYLRFGPGPDAVLGMSRADGAPAAVLRPDLLSAAYGTSISVRRVGGLDAPHVFPE